MPTVMRRGPYRLYFFSHEPNDIHVDRDDRSAKFWLQSVALARNAGFNAKELNEIQRIVREKQSTLLEVWYGYFGTERG